MRVGFVILFGLMLGALLALAASTGPALRDRDSVRGQLAATRDSLWFERQHCQTLSRISFGSRAVVVRLHDYAFSPSPDRLEPWRMVLFPGDSIDVYARKSGRFGPLHFAVTLVAPEHAR